ncbi:MAG: hypothetical protein KF819_26340 [Labilithrix sp.]|nr:hypothetical protein [Labilithrix sp.]
MRRGFLCAFCLLATAATACKPPPPVTTASGEQVERITLQERFALSTDVKGERLDGERLRKGLPIMERTGAFSVEGDYATSGVVDKSTLTVTITFAGGREHRAALANCAEPKICAFVSEAIKEKLLEREPAVCKSEKVCAKK